MLGMQTHRECFLEKINKEAVLYLTMRGGKKLKDHFLIGHLYEKDFRRQIRSFITITLAFGIAFSWRQTAFDVSEYIVRLVTHIQPGTASSIITSVFITMVSILLIYFTSYGLKDKYPTHSY